MCGIAGYNGTKTASHELLYSLSRLEYRGYDSAGIATINGELKVGKGLGNLTQVANDKNLQDFKGTIGIGHTRWATHGGVTVNNAHPHVDCKNQIAIVHNGIIENYLELRKKLKKHTFQSDTDTEVIAHLIEENIDKGFDYAFCIAIKQLIGSFAIVACHTPDKYLLAACKDAPLLIGKCVHGNYVVSDIQALGKDVTKLIECRDDRYYVIHKDSAAISMDNNCDWQYERIDGIEFNAEEVNSDKTGYAHFMLKEIYEQPEALVNALNQDEHQITGVAMDILRAKNVIITACGTSRYASIVGRYLMSKLAKRFTEVVVGSELHHFADSFDGSTLIIAVSQSGETADVLQGVRLAKQAKSKIVSIINKPYSLLERVSDTTLFMKCGAEVAVASTKAFTNELMLFYQIAFAMSNQYKQGVSELKELAEIVKECFDPVFINNVAVKLSQCPHIYYVGKGINFAVAGECSLKLKEVSYLHAESMSAGELKHGTLSLIEKGTPVIAICPNDYTYNEVISNLHEAKSRGALIIGISDRDNEVFDTWLEIPSVKDIYYPVVCVIVGQMLAYFTAINRGLNPDFPRSLAKSVTVK